jgi:hypothetical protein
MKQLIKWIIDFIISFLKDLAMKSHIEKLEKEVDDAKEKAEKDVERANESYHEFMAMYSDYQSDLKRRGHGEMSTMRTDARELRRSGKETEKSNRQPDGSNKETKKLDK